MPSRESTRTRLLDAADELFFTRGVRDTPVDEVLERAGASPATLYRAYGTKDGLVAAALERRHREWIEVWDAAVAAADDDEQRLLAVFTALEQFRARPAGARWCAFLGTAAEHPDPSSALAAALAAESESLRARLTDLAGPVAGARAAVVAEALVVLVSGQLAMRLRTGGGDLGVARAAASVLVARADDLGRTLTRKGASAPER